MVGEALLVFVLASGSGSLATGRKNYVFNSPEYFLSPKRIEKFEASRVWLETRKGSGATRFPEPLIGTGSSVFLTETKPKVEINDLVNVIVKIQSVFSLNISEVASIAGVQRPTIYAWVNGDSIPHNSNHRRLQGLYALAETVQINFGTKLGKLQKSRSISGLTLIDLLSRDKVSQEEVMKHVHTLVGASGELEARVRSFREMAKAANKDITVNQDGQKAIDHLTGKRLTES